MIDTSLVLPMLDMRTTAPNYPISKSADIGKPDI